MSNLTSLSLELNLRWITVVDFATESKYLSLACCTRHNDYKWSNINSV